MKKKKVTKEKTAEEDEEKKTRPKMTRYSLAYSTMPDKKRSPPRV